MSWDVAEDKKELGYVIQTVPIRADIPNKLDTKMSSREKDGATIKLPAHSNACPVQLWEVYVVTAILVMQPKSSILTHHVRALCEHHDSKSLCCTVLKEHTSCGAVNDSTQDISLHAFFEEYFHRKFSCHFGKHSLTKYIGEVLEDPLCGWQKIPRVYYVSVFVQALLLNSPFMEGQYQELIESMRMVNLPVNDVMLDKELQIGEAKEVTWDNVKLYDDPQMILKRYGGWAISKTERMLSPKDQLVMRLTGCSLEQLLSGVDVPDSPRGGQGGEHGAATDGDQDKKGGAEEDDASDISDFEIDPEHAKICPLGLTLCEMFLLLRGILMAGESKNPSFHGCVVGHNVAKAKDRHVLAASVLMDLYMREQIDVSHWTIKEGTTAVCYKAERRKGLGKMDHFLDNYAHDTERVFEDMRLPAHVNDEVIWRSLEARGIIDNHRYASERFAGLGHHRIDLWDLIRPDVLLDFKAAYLASAQVLYDKGHPDPLDETANDLLMFIYLIQLLFDHCHEAIDGMARLMKMRCPPFEKGELYAPVTMIHSGAVCSGLVDRAFRIANGMDTQLASEAADFNELVMQRLEHKFFLSPNIWQSFDVDQSGELTIEEFVEGMRNIDVYKDFRKERVPEDVLRMIVSDLAERLFQEVDINMDGTLTPEELQSAFTRRHEEESKKAERNQWVRRHIKGVALQMGLAGSDDQENESFKMAMKKRDKAVKHSRLKEAWRKREWQSEVDRVELPDDQVDPDTNAHHKD